jgi:transketolase
MLPGMEVMQPGSKSELETLVRERYRSGHATYLRIAHDEHGQDLPCRFGEGVVVREGDSGVTVMTAGPILGNVLAACRDLPVNIVYFHTLKPLDQALVARYRSTRVLVVHDSHGLHEAISEVPDMRTAYHGLPDAFCGHYGTLDDVRRQIGLDAAGIRAAVQRRLADAAEV